MKKYLKYIALLLMIGVGIGLFQYHKPHQNLSRSNADFKLTATALYNDFETDETAANAKYLDKIIDVSGKIQGYTQNGDVTSISLESESGMFGVLCELDVSMGDIEDVYKKGMMIRLRGVCSGMLSDVVLVRCVLAK